MIRLARSGDVPQLRRIWRVCFGDGDDYLDLFFRSAFQPENTLVCQREHGLCSMLYLLDSTVWNSGREYSAAYVYAAATLPEYRSQGVMGEMIRRAAGLSRERGTDCLALVPANDSLFDYYGTFGFRPYFYTQEKWITRANPSQTPSADSQLHLVEMERIRRERLRKTGGLMWNGRMFSYAVKEHLFTGGRIFYSPWGYVLYHMENGVCRVEEQIVCPGKNREFEEAFLNGVRAMDGTAWASCGGCGTEKIRGMLLPLGEDAMVPDRMFRPYIGLTLG